MGESWRLRQLDAVRRVAVFRPRFALAVWEDVALAPALRVEPVFVTPTVLCAEATGRVPFFVVVDFFFATVAPLVFAAVEKVTRRQAVAARPAAVPPPPQLLRSNP